MWHEKEMLKKVALSGLESTCSIVRNFANQVTLVLQVHKWILCASLPPNQHPNPLLFIYQALTPQKISLEIQNEV